MKSLLVATLLVSCARPQLVDAVVPVQHAGDVPIEARITCAEPTGDVITCAVSHDGPETCPICWVVELRCANGSLKRAKACDVVSPGVEVQHVLGRDDFGDARCDRPTSGRITEAFATR